jgi:hypothetical protein
MAPTPLGSPPLTFLRTRGDDGRAFSLPPYFAIHWHAMVCVATRAQFAVFRLELPKVIKKHAFSPKDSKD